MGPDMPAWTIQPYSDHDQDQSSSESSSEATQVSDTLERTLANVAKAEDLVDAGKKDEAESAIQAALLSLDGVPRSEPGVKQVRDKLDDLRDRCDRMSSSTDPLRTDDGADGAGTALRQLGPVKAERNDRVDKWIDFFTGRGREQFQKYLSRSGVYMDLLMHNLRAEGVPEELANLSSSRADSTCTRAPWRGRWARGSSSAAPRSSSG